MKTETEIHTALAGLVLLMGKATDRTPGQIKARHSADMLLWVMGYPSDFDHFFPRIQELNLPIDNINKAIKELVDEYKQKPDPDTQTE